VLEADLGDDTLLRWGRSYEKQDNTGWNVTVLSRTVSGADLGLKRSTCLCTLWNFWDFKSPEFFVALQHRKEV
jgi:outer membrane receptor for ferric coprogen and ferric-rhodotorulic acid